MFTLQIQNGYSDEFIHLFIYLLLLQVSAMVRASQRGLCSEHFYSPKFSLFLIFILFFILLTQKHRGVFPHARWWAQHANISSI